LTADVLAAIADAAAEAAEVCAAIENPSIEDTAAVAELALTKADAADVLAAMADRLADAALVEAWAA